GIAQKFAPLQKNEAERALIQSLSQCLEHLDQINATDREDIRAVLGKITRAQEMDLERFDESGQPRALGTAAELEQYTYLIAGCVGEFWSQLCLRHVSDFSELPAGEMFDLGKRYGVGLQLINILRDAGSDLKAGRCSFPADELS